MKTKWHVILLALVLVSCAQVPTVDTTQHPLLLATQPEKELPSVSPFLEHTIAASTPSSGLVQTNVVPTAISTRTSQPQIEIQTPVPELILPRLEMQTVSPNSDEVFFWRAVDPDSFYVRSVLKTNQFETNFIYKARYLTDSGVMRTPSGARNMAFAAYSPEVAYLKRGLQDSEEPGELWVAALRIEEAEKVWVDEKGWLGDVSFLDSEMTWGETDRYVILTSQAKETQDHMLVYDLEARRAYQWIGSCKTLARSLVSRQISVWCKLNGAAGLTYAVLDSSGVIEGLVQPPSVIAETLAWRFSPNGKRVLFIGDDLTWRIANEDGSLLELPVTFYPNPYLYDQARGLNIQWNRAGDRVLAYGQDQGKSRCTKKREMDVYYERGCWFVLDAKSGEFIWWMKSGAGTGISEKLEDISFDYNMAFSPDGYWLIGTLRDASLPSVLKLVIISVTDGHLIDPGMDLTLLPTYYITWAH